MGSVHQLWWWVLVTLTERIRSLGTSHANYEWRVLLLLQEMPWGKAAPVEAQKKTKSECGTMKGKRSPVVVVSASHTYGKDTLSRH